MDKTVGPLWFQTLHPHKAPENAVSCYNYINRFNISGTSQNKSKMENVQAIKATVFVSLNSDDRTKTNIYWSKVLDKLLA